MLARDESVSYLLHYFFALIISMGRFQHPFTYESFYSRKTSDVSSSPTIFVYLLHPMNYILALNIYTSAIYALRQKDPCQSNCGNAARRMLMKLTPTIFELRDRDVLVKKLSVLYIRKDTRIFKNKI